jgi:hypothetical protein
LFNFFYSAFLAAFFGAAFLAAAFAGALAVFLAAVFYFFWRTTPVDPICILPRLVLLSPFPIINFFVYVCKSKKLSLPIKLLNKGLSFFMKRSRV